MEIEINDYLCQPRDSKLEKELLRKLRELPEDVRYNVVREVLQKNTSRGLLMASSSLRQKRYFGEILEMGFEVGDASTILPWLNCAVPKLGFRKVLLSLSNRMDSDLAAVDNALYWMPRFKPQNDPKADIAWEEIKIRRQKKAMPTARLERSHRMVPENIQIQQQTKIVLTGNNDNSD